MSRVWDVVVVGGGGAGVAAAAAAGRVGARTLLLEAAPHIGGTALRSVLSVVCGAFQQAPEPRWLGPGLSQWVGRALQADGGAPVKIGGLWVQPFQAGRWRQVLGRLVEGGGVTVRTATAFTAAAAETLSPGAWVDCSGDGVTAEVLGVRSECSQRPALQVPAVSGLVGPVEVAVLLSARAHLVLARAVEAGRLPAAAAHLRVHRSGPGVLLKLNLEPPADWDPLDPPVRQDLLTHGLAVLDASLDVLRAGLPPFAPATWRAQSQALGVRESRRLVGRARLEAEHVLGGARHADAVAVGAWPIELWPTPDHQELRRVRGTHYDVPLGVLRAADRDDLFFAGRCVSASHEALGSIRVLGSCLETGQAAGTAAALHALEGQVDAAAVQPWRAWPGV